MRKGREGFPCLVIVVALLSLFLFSACSGRQARMSPVAAVLTTSAFSPDGKFIAAGRNIFNVVHIYDGQTARFKKALLGDEEQPYDVVARSLSISKDSNYLAAAGIDDMVVVWDTNDDQIKMRLTDCKGAMTVSFSPKENILAASGPGNSVTLWKVPEGNKVGELIGHSAPVLAMAFSPDGAMFATGGADKAVKVWRIADSQPVSTYDQTAYPVHSLSFTPDGASLAVYAGELKIWKWGETGSKVSFAPGQESFATAMVGVLTFVNTGIARNGADQAVRWRLPAIFSPEGRFLAAVRYNAHWAGDYEIVLHDTTTGKNRFIPGAAVSISFSPDGKTLAAVGPFGLSRSLRLIDPVSAEWIQPDEKR